jgi:hypothetical protein
MEDGDLADFYAMATGCDKIKAPVLLVERLVAESLLPRPVAI